jgi:hypothetical protein
MLTVLGTLFNGLVDLGNGGEVGGFRDDGMMGGCLIVVLRCVCFNLTVYDSLADIFWMDRGLRLRVGGF